MAENLTIYMHVLSPFAATVVATANHLNIPHTERQIDLRANEQKTDWYLKINPAGKIPAIKDGDKCMAESFDICKYLVKSRELKTEFYPIEDEKKCEEIDRIMNLGSKS